MTSGKPAKKTRYAVVGLGGRSVMYSGAILSTYADRAELVGICDINPERMAYYLREWQSQHGKGGAYCLAPSCAAYPRCLIDPWCLTARRCRQPG